MNGTNLYLNDQIKVTVNSNERIKISCHLSETKEKYNDYASESIDLSYSELLGYKNDGFYVPVKIRESNGRYAGNTAQMNFYISIK